MDHTQYTNLNFTNVRKSQVILEDPVLNRLHQEKCRNEPDSEIEYLRDLTGKPVVRVSNLKGCERKGWHAHHVSPATGRKPGDNWALLKGTIFHAGMAALGSDDPGREHRLVGAVETEPYGTVLITGKPDRVGVDLVETDDGPAVLITDYKTTGGRLPEFPRERDVLQLAIYGWLLRQNYCDLPLYGRLTYINGSGLYGPTFALAPATTAQVAAAVLPLLGAEADATAEPLMGTWECNYCDYRQCERHPETTVATVTPIALEAHPDTDPGITEEDLDSIFGPRRPDTALDLNVTVIELAPDTPF